MEPPGVNKPPWVDYHGVTRWRSGGHRDLESSQSASAFPRIGTYAITACSRPTPSDCTTSTARRIRRRGHITLPAGETITLRYRFLFHRGNEKDGGVAEAFQAYSQERGSSNNSRP